MDNHKHLHIPDNFSFIIRSGGANLRYSEFKVSCAIAVRQVRHIALTVHNNCGMLNLISRKNEFVNVPVTMHGWEKERAEEHFRLFVPMIEIENETYFIFSETKRFQLCYPKVSISPLLFMVEVNKLNLIEKNKTALGQN